MANSSTNDLQSVRLDKWLWAARFYKTRSLAADAIKTGKVLVDNVKVKPSKEVTPGNMVTVKQGIYTKTVEIRILSNRRGPATVAATLYSETSESIANRERLKDIQQAQPAIRDRGQGRPTKRERRQIISFTAKND